MTKLLTDVLILLAFAALHLAGKGNIVHMVSVKRGITGLNFDSAIPRLSSLNYFIFIL